MSSPEPYAAERGGSLWPCPLCGAAKAVIQLDLSDLVFTCDECAGEFTRRELQERLAQWQILLDWVDKVPKAVQD